MARIYADENFPLPAVVELRRLGHDVLTTMESGHSDRAMPDAQVLDFAISENRAILTLNRRHFIRLHSERPRHNGIIVCSFDIDFISLARRIHSEISQHPSLNGRLLRVNRIA